MTKQDDRIFREMGVGEIMNVRTGQLVCQVSLTDLCGSDFRDCVDLICDALNDRYYPEAKPAGSPPFLKTDAPVPPSE
jgi:hypothetical protein